MSLTWRYTINSMTLNRINFRTVLTRALALRLLFIIIVLPSVSVAQDEHERQVFIRTGVDLSRFALPFINNYGLSGLELSIDTEIKYNFFPTVEAGFNRVKDYTELHEYDLYGNYFRVGLNYSVTKYQHRLDRNIFFIGARYGYSGFSHQANRISITNQWGIYDTSFPTTNLNAHWFEGVIGLRGEVFKNLFLGFTIRVKSMITHSDYKNYTPYWVPGYGEATKSIAIGMSYSVFYAFPLKKLELKD